MFSLGFFEIVALAVIALVVVGPERLPTMARNIGRFLTELKRTTNTITSDISAQIDEDNFFKEKKKAAETQPLNETPSVEEVEESEILEGDEYE